MIPIGTVVVWRPKDDEPYYNSRVIEAKLVDGVPVYRLWLTRDYDRVSDPVTEVRVQTAWDEMYIKQLAAEAEESEKLRQMAYAVSEALSYWNNPFEDICLEPETFIELRESVKSVLANRHGMVKVLTSWLEEHPE